jgi:hypothetical protein
MARPGAYSGETRAGKGGIAGKAIERLAPHCFFLASAREERATGSAVPPAGVFSKEQCNPHWICSFRNTPGERAKGTFALGGWPPSLRSRRRPATRQGICGASRAVSCACGVAAGMDACFYTGYPLQVQHRLRGGFGVSFPVSCPDSSHRAARDGGLCGHGIALGNLCRRPA